MLSLALPGLQGEDGSHRLPVEGPADQGGSAQSLHEEIWEGPTGTAAPSQRSQHHPRLRHQLLPSLGKRAWGHPCLPTSPLRLEVQGTGLGGQGNQGSSGLCTTDMESPGRVSAGGSSLCTSGMP